MVPLHPKPIMEEKRVSVRKDENLFFRIKNKKTRAKNMHSGARLRMET
jgi:hypothetical protein